jgi:hypothetical protein
MSLKMFVSRLVRFYYLKCIHYFQVKKYEHVKLMSVITFSIACVSFGAINTLFGVVFDVGYQLFFGAFLAFFSCIFCLFLLPIRFAFIVPFALSLFYVCYLFFIAYVCKFAFFIFWG